MHPEGDTIAAIATPIGQAGIGILRISGPMAFRILHRIFKPVNAIPPYQSHRLYLGHILEPESDQTVDEVLVSFMKAPNSYTREDVVEINSHSGYFLLSKILKIILDQGAKLAQPGEFTARAFLNGRIDLTQAEAVIDLINAQSEKGLHLASQQVRGFLGKEIEKIRDRILAILAQVEVAIDFPEEEAVEINRDQWAKAMEEEALGPVLALVKSHADKRLWVDGIQTVIVGRVNAGKSSLLNRLLNERRAIVTPVSGTTRDIIESTLSIKGLPLRLMDTAGFREVEDEVEKIGLQLTEEKLAEADFLLVVIDRSRPLNGDDIHILDKAKGKKAIVVLNKSDLPSAISLRDLNTTFSGFQVLEISALTGQGIDALRESIFEYILANELELSTSHSGPNIRHQTSLEEAVRFLEDGIRSIQENLALEIIALELKSAIDALGQIIGETTDEDVLDHIFSQFCLGK